MKERGVTIFWLNQKKSAQDNFFFYNYARDARILLVRDGAVTAIMGLLFLITLLPLKTQWFTV